MLVNGFHFCIFTSPGIHQIWKQTFQQFPENFWPPTFRKLWKSHEESCSCNSYGLLCKFCRVESGSAAATTYMSLTQYQILCQALYICNSTYSDPKYISLFPFLNENSEVQLTYLKVTQSASGRAGVGIQVFKDYILYHQLPLPSINTARF